MAIGIDEIDDFEPSYEPGVIEGSTVTYNNNVEPDTTHLEPSEEDEFMSDFLKSKGIDDPSRIKFEENGHIIEKNWNDLSREEQINILNTPLERYENTPAPETDLSQEEIDLLNQIRTNNLTPSEYLEKIKEQSSIIEPTYKVDDLSDDELYLLDLESKVGELSEEEAIEALNNAKQNETLYNKQIQGLRQEYKDREEFNYQLELAEQEQLQQEIFLKYQNDVVNAIDTFDSIGNLDLNFSDEDKDELARFMLSQTESGVNLFTESLKDPQTLVKTAWFILHGDEAFDNIVDYFTNLIKLVSENQYKKGYNEGLLGESTKPQLFIKPQDKSNEYQPVNSIEELW